MADPATGTSLVEAEGVRLALGYTYRMSYANEDSQRTYQREWTRRRRAEWIESQGGRCVECGSADRLEVDHIDPATKLMNLGAVWSSRAEVREAELAKCQVLCHDCHLKKTVGDPPPHGNRNRYRAGCRCDACKRSNTEHSRKMRLKSRQ